MTTVDDRSQCGTGAGAGVEERWPDGSLVDPGGWLEAHRWEMERGEASWLETLAEFDRDRGWEADGQLSGVDWLVWRTKMARSTAYEKLRVAHQIARRSVVRDAFAVGRISYSAVRVITRIDDPDPEVDAALVDLAESATVEDVSRMVGYYERHAEQDHLPAEIGFERGFRVRGGPDGFGTIEITLSNLEIAEVGAIIQAFIDRRSPMQMEGGHNYRSSPADFGAPEDSSAGESPPFLAPSEDGSWAAKRADAFMEVARVALEHAAGGQAAGADRYMLHVVRTGEEATLPDGTPIDRATAERIACDSSTVEHEVGDTGEPLYVGRRTREWSTAQRRAITVRDGGRCRFPGCHCRYVDIHHIRYWSKGGLTDIDNGLLLCPRHHTLVHARFAAAGNANEAVTFSRPNGTVIGITRPWRRSRRPQPS